MKCADLFAARERTLSFEFFPPKDERSWYTLEDSIEQLAQLGPDFVSVTYGAGGSTRAKTREIVEHLQKNTGLVAMAHLTCVGHTVDELKALFDEYAGAGIENLLALRGDPPKGQSVFTPVPGGCRNAGELLGLIQADGRFSALVAAFPDRHPEAPSRESDWGFTAAKFQGGAVGAITQCFFDPQAWIDQRDWLTARLGRVPRIIPGILPVTDWNALERFCTRCGAAIPDALRARLAPLAGDKRACRRAGIAWTVDFCDALLRAGAPGLHLYCLNRSTAAAEIVTALRLRGHPL